MDFLSAIPLSIMADATAAANDMRSFVMPWFNALILIAGVACAAFIALGGYHMMTSSGNPERLAQAKKIIRNAIIGLVIVVGAGLITSALNHSYENHKTGSGQSLPTIAEVKQKDDGFDPADLVIKAINGLLANVINSIGQPVTDTLTGFTKATPLMADTGPVFNLWLGVVAIADVLFILAVALLGFHIMSAEALGFEEIEFKHLLPQIGLAFLLVNTSIFAIDAVIALSNAIIHALYLLVDNKSVWDVLKSVVENTSDMGIAALFIMIAFVIMAIMLLIYYLMRLVTLFLGAVLSPLVMTLWLLPSFRDFANTAIRSYFVTIFVLVVHVVIMILAAALLDGMNGNDLTNEPIMAVMLGIATLALLLRTQGVLSQMAYASAGAKSTRKLGTQFVNGVSHLSSKMASSQKAYAANQIQTARAQYVVNTMATQGKGSKK